MRCLIVDDSVLYLRAARALLVREGIAVSTASTAAEARHLIDMVEPDVVLIDIDLGMDSGFELAAELSEGAASKARQIFLVSTHSLEDFEELVLQSPARGFLGKSALSASAIMSMMDRGA